MQGKCNLDLSFVLSEAGFSFDELVECLTEQFAAKGYVRILELIIGLAQEVLVSRLFAGRALPVHCCEGAHFTLVNRQARSLRCSLGTVRVSAWRVKCSCCGRTHSLLNGLLHLARYQRKSTELERIVVEAACGTSYRRAVQDLARDHLVSVPYRTAQEWVMKSSCDELRLSNQVIGSLPVEVFADGTKFKGAGVGGAARQGDLKVVIGVSQAGSIFPLGTYAGQSWADINRDWKQHQIRLPNGSIFISDGEPGLASALADYASEQQRCHWHIDRDLYHAFWQDGVNPHFSNPIRDALRGVLAIELPREDYLAVPEAEKDAIEERMENAERAIDLLIDFLIRKHYQAAASYLLNARRGMFGYVRRWLKWGLISPRASSMVERVMREIGRRLKNIAYGWSDQGAAKMTRIILKRFAQPREWENYWKAKEKLVGKVMMFFGKFSVSSQELAH